MAQNNNLLRIEDLVLHFGTTRGSVQAVDKVNFALNANQAVVVLGESGCGKSSLAKAILRLLPRNVVSYSGRVYLDGNDVMQLNEEEFRQNIRWASISMVPQAAMNSLICYSCWRPGCRTCHHSPGCQQARGCFSGQKDVPACRGS